MSSLYRVETEAIRVEIGQGSGPPIVGDMFLRPGVASHSGMETVRDRLADATPFFPLRVASDPPETLFIGKSRIRYLRAPSPPEDDSSMLERAIAPSVEVDVVLDSGEELTGTIYIMLPSGQSRLLDFLNQTDVPYLCLAQGERDCFVNLAHVRFMRERSAK